MKRNRTGDYLFKTFNGLFMLGLVVVTLYPFLYVLFASISDPVRLGQHIGFLSTPSASAWLPTGSCSRTP